MGFYLIYPSVRITMAKVQVHYGVVVAFYVPTMVADIYSLAQPVVHAQAECHGTRIPRIVQAPVQDNTTVSYPH